MSSLGNGSLNVDFKGGDSVLPATPTSSLAGNAAEYASAKMNGGKRFKKGSRSAKMFMAKLRAMRKSKKSKKCKKGQKGGEKGDEEEGEEGEGEEKFGGGEEMGMDTPRSNLEGEDSMAQSGGKRRKRKCKKTAKKSSSKKSKRSAKRRMWPF